MATYADAIEEAHAALGLDVFANPEQVRKAFRRRASESHPNHGGSADAFRRVHTAAELLTLPDIREFYEQEAAPRISPR
jgi:molecular chaperone DnaJ